MPRSGLRGAPRRARVSSLLATMMVGLIVAGSSSSIGISLAADHDDTPMLKGMGRHDARITDLFAFRDQQNLVLILCLNPTIPPEVRSYRFAPDLTVKLFIDNRSPVDFRDPVSNALFGGTILFPQLVREQVVIEFTFDALGNPRLRVAGGRRFGALQVRYQTGLFDDPFIRYPRRGRNVAAIVVSVPLYQVVVDQPALLIWATADVPEVAGPMVELGGRALRSMFVPDLNMMSPSEHLTRMGQVPDVIIYNVNQPAHFPNGRALTDDVVDMSLDIPLPGGVLPGEAPGFPSENDKPFRTAFPYLATPHLAN